ncbi:hypothetical protein BB559_003001 [Furculomyces boomerangus]|uniref:Uncharacterized protein n=1 Tax=Furculomyces boomerangus TaxID=61424 RepID=A0A2T9YQ58_9FUNG|nr:hypothetical protein BB559_003001 [Furculomyces boomerangus]
MTTYDEMIQSGHKFNFRHSKVKLRGIFGGSESVQGELAGCTITLNKSLSPVNLITAESNAFQVLLGMPWQSDVKLTFKVLEDDKIRYELGDIGTKDRVTLVSEKNCETQNKTNKEIFFVTNEKIDNLEPELGLNEMEKICNMVYKKVESKVLPANVQHRMNVRNLRG